jgi:phosphonate transport system permease protein
MVESIVMTVASTVVGILISIPIGLGAARNIAPLPVYLICRGIVAISRALNEIIVAILLVAIFGFGPLAGLPHPVLCHHRLPRQAAGRGHRGDGQGAGRSHPRHRRELAAMDQLRGPAAGDAAADRPVDVPPRHQLPRIAVLGLVGAGGIGATLNTAFDRYEFDTAAAILLIIIVIVMVLEYLSGIIRAKVQ